MKKFENIGNSIVDIEKLYSKINEGINHIKDKKNNNNKKIIFCQIYKLINKKLKII